MKAAFVMFLNNLKAELGTAKSNGKNVHRLLFLSKCLSIVNWLTFDMGV